MHFLLLFFVLMHRMALWPSWEASDCQGPNPKTRPFPSAPKNPEGPWMVTRLDVTEWKGPLFAPSFLPIFADEWQSFPERFPFLAFFFLALSFLLVAQVRSLPFLLSSSYRHLSKLPFATFSSLQHFWRKMCPIYGVTRIPNSVENERTVNYVTRLAKRKWSWKPTFLTMCVGNSMHTQQTGLKDE